MTNANPFDDAEIISIYTDADALADGVLVNIAPLGITFQDQPVNRMTGTLWGDFQLTHADPQTGEMNTRALADNLHAKISMAAMRGGIWQLPSNLWLIENEMKGWTLMFPEDY